MLGSTGAAVGSAVGCAVGLGVTGARVGAAVGATDGMCVGAALGWCEGPTVGLSVGPCVGAADGVWVGSFVGAAVGFMVGPWVGAAVGLSVGPRVGAAVGLVVGLWVGPCVGAAVGPSVGACVGAADGWSVGDAEGLWVGAADGLSVGPAVGAAVGDAVIGAAVVVVHADEVISVRASVSPSKLSTVDTSLGSPAINSSSVVLIKSPTPTAWISTKYGAARRAAAAIGVASGSVDCPSVMTTNNRGISGYDRTPLPVYTVSRTASSPRLVKVRKKVCGMLVARSSTMVWFWPSSNVRITEADSEKVTIATWTCDGPRVSACVKFLMKLREASQPSAGTEPEASTRNARSSTFLQGSLNWSGVCPITAVPRQRVARPAMRAILVMVRGCREE
eukprot:m.436005 g.436005  ORF g.436005 m.436005 type:complete len:391 (-) comp17926_c0_seq1:75-1247(-)